MRKVVLNLAVSLDGFIEGPNGEIDWCIMDDEMNFDTFVDSIDTIFYGRVSYDAWGNFRPQEHTSPPDKIDWQKIHSKHKIVFSSHNRVDDRAVFISSDIANRVGELKKQSGKDIWLYGGANLIKTFVHLELIDIYKISIHPIALGSGKPLFEGLTNRLNFRLLNTRAFKSGVVELTYGREKPECQL